MSSDLVQRLREEFLVDPSCSSGEAADRIEQLEAERDEARAEVEKLREALEAIREIGKADLYAYDHHAPFHAAVYTAMRALADTEEADDA